MVDARKVNKKDRKILSKHLEKENKNYSLDLKPIPYGHTTKTTDELIGVYRSKIFLVQKYKIAENIIRLSIMRTSINIDTGDWLEGITWDHLQSIKNELGFLDSDAIEVYPKQGDLVNVANIRHLWVFLKDSPLDFIWRKKK